MQFVSNHFTVIYDMLDHIKHIGATIYESCLRIIYNSEIIDAGRLRIIYNGEISAFNFIPTKLCKNSLSTLFF